LGIGPSVRAAPISVFVSLLPQKYFVERVGGDHVEIGVMVMPGQSPATFAPTPKQMVQLAGSAAYFRIGVPFEDVWIERIHAANPNMKMVDARDGITLRPMKVRHHDDEHRHGRHDPHIWTAPPLVKIMAARIRDTLSELDPAHRKNYEANYANFAADLDALDQEIRQTLKDKKTRKFMVYHPAWGYFADTYGLEQIPIEVEGKEPDANAETVADAIDGAVVSVDPLAENYLENLREIARIFAETLR
jgi:zinc transport system substrate-binding protein